MSLFAANLGVLSKPHSSVAVWTEAGSSPSSYPLGANGAHRLTVYWARAVGGDSPPLSSVTASGQLAQVIAIRDCVASGNPFDSTSSSSTGSGATTETIPGVTTTVNNCLILAALNIMPGPNNFNAWFSGWTNANLSNLTERMDQTKVVGGFGLVTGGLATAGASGGTTVTIANTVQKAYWCGALKPAGASIPTVVGVGVFAQNSTAISPALPAGTAAGDILIVLAATRNETITFS